jgi:RHS repeat-associated protein
LEKAKNEPIASEHSSSVPAISLPKGGGAIRGIGEKFAANPVTGTGSMSVPIATSPGRSGFGPQLSLAYDSGSGNGPFGFGWSLSLPSVTRKTEKGLPQYQDANESDVFILSGAEDLVPVLRVDGTRYVDETTVPGYTIHRYRPRIEGLFARIERWTNRVTGEAHWRSITKDNITTLYGRDNSSRIFDPQDPNPNHPRRVFSWLICQSYDDTGNAIVYEYKAENSENIDLSQAHEQNRTDVGRSANRYVKRIKYGNRTPNRDATWQVTDPSQLSDWMFEVVFDYGEGHYSEDAPDAQERIFAHPELTPPAGSRWPVRQDPFSHYRAGFEVRTYRLCRRVLMFHHFLQELGINDHLVRSTEFTYTESPIASFIIEVAQSGYMLPDLAQPNRYLKKSLPPLEFTYSQVPDAAQLAQQPVEEVDAGSLENLPIGLDGRTYQWVDLDGEGTSGIFTEQSDGWYYKRNLSANNQIRENGGEHTVARLGTVELISAKPTAGLAGGQAQFLDLAGDGQIDLVQMEGSVRGFYERTEENDWVPFQPFVSWPNLNIHEPNLKFVDVTGDGHADILITEDEVLTWYPSLAEEGFGPAERTQHSLDEEKGPRLVFSDGTQSIHLADLCGDGLTDLVRIRNGEVCYWPNLGYGRFGAKVTMDNSPWFDLPDLFEQERIRLVDTDGSGTTDIIYLGRKGVQIFFNQSGNRWSPSAPLPQFPPIDNLAAVQALDLLGNGTACLVWSSPLPGNSRRPMRYIGLMNEKPHLLVMVKNNLGAETHIHYAPSTKFYLNDKQAGKPWVTRLPFPVHVVERVETYDWISRNRFVTRYAFHHGYFDGPEREFRGFGMVEQWDTEEIGTITTTPADNMNWDAASFVPPVLTRTWFHTGAFADQQNISRHFVNEYYREGDASHQISGLTDAQLQAESLDDTVLPTTILRADGSRSAYQLTAVEVREACRSLKGSILRQEIYGRDNTDAADRPYSVSERNYSIEVLQPQSINKHSVYFTHPREQIDFHYERILVDVNGTKHADPRVSHAMTLEVDAFGNVLRTLAIGYRRRDLPGVNEPEQQATHLSLTVNRFANRPNETDWYRMGMPVETRTYEIVKPPEPTISDFLVQLFKFDEMVAHTTGLFPLNQDEPSANKVWSYENWDWRRNASNAPGETRLRLIEQVRTLYRKDDLSGFLPFGNVESLALPGESYKLAFTPDLLTRVYGRRVTDPILADEGRYVHSAGDANWWIPSGRIFHSPNSGDSPQQELTFARAHFFLPHRYRNPFHTNIVNTETVASFDTHNLLMQETRDALGNVVIAENDYRVLQPYRVTDPNGNRAEAAFDVLGLVVGTAVRGKQTENLGDILVGFEADLNQAQIDELHDALDPHTLAPTLLIDAGTRIVYDPHRFHHSQQAHPTDSTQWEPPYAATLARETHAPDPLPPHGLKIQITFSYSDGFGREIQKKIQAEPGEAEVEDAAGNITVVDTSPALRWVGSGWTIFNNKGKPVRQYEPFFSTHRQFQFGKKVGVSPVLFYDPVERVVATLHPNHSWEKVVFDPWQQKTYDVNDTITFDPKTDADVSAFFDRLPDTEYLPTWYQQRVNGALGTEEKSAADKAAQHADTPTVACFDSLGRTFLTIAQNRFQQNNSVVDEPYPTRIVLDIEGNQREVIDARERIVMRYDYDILSSKAHQASMEAGERWVLNDVTGKPIRAWDSRRFLRRMTYDELRRPVGLYVTENGAERLAGRSVYGESLGEAANHRTRLYQVFDGAGIVTNVAYDFKGNLLEGRRDLLPDYRQAVDWLRNPAASDGSFTSRTTFDALNRPLSASSPDGSVYHPAFNEANLLERVDVNLRGAAAPSAFVSNIDYDAKGRRERIVYGNGALTSYEYDPLTLRLARLRTTRPADDDVVASQLFENSGTLQDLSYTYDPAGNLTCITDAALKTVFYNGQQIDPTGRYTYDALYRLIEARGREHLAQTAFDFSPPDGNYRDNPFAGLAARANDLQALRNYIEYYEYDQVGNFDALRHVANGGSWTRRYDYAEVSLLEPGELSNRLSRTTVGSGSDRIEPYSYDAHGNMTGMPHLQGLAWDFKDQLQQAGLNGGNAYYVYDAAGQRARKVIERNGARAEEHIYLGACEIYRNFQSGAPQLERESLHIMDDKRRMALVETLTMENGRRVDAPASLQRYQLGNHLGSAGVELARDGALISYEEYHPYGTTAFQAGRSAAELNLKRYRYTGKERDEESGFSYHGARYYVLWLGRWLSTDPLGISDGMNLYCYVHDRPLNAVDPSGMQYVDIGEDPALRGAARELHNAGLDLAARPPSGGPRRIVSYQQARAEANEGAADFRQSQGMSGGDVQAGHTQAARHTSMSGASRAQVNDPATFQHLHSRRGRGLDVTVTDPTGHTRVTTRHRAQEGIIDTAVQRVQNRNHGRLTPRGHAQAGAEVLWRTRGTGFDQREVAARRASGSFDEAHAINQSEAVQALRLHILLFGEGAPAFLSFNSGSGGSGGQSGQARVRVDLSEHVGIRVDVVGQPAGQEQEREAPGASGKVPQIKGSLSLAEMDSAMEESARNRALEGPLSDDPFSDGHLGPPIGFHPSAFPGQLPLAPGSAPAAAPFEPVNFFEPIGAF